MAADDREQKLSALRALLSDDVETTVIPMEDVSGPSPFDDHPDLENVIGSSACEVMDDMTGGCVKTMEQALSDIHAAQSNNLHQYVEKYENIKTHTHTDAQQRQFYVFDDGSAQPTVVVIFSVGNNKLVSINDVVFSHQDLFSVNSMNALSPTLRFQASFDSRREPPSCSPTVVLEMTNKTVQIPNTTVPIMLMVLSRLSAA
jgi:hypothetical protein